MDYEKLAGELPSFSDTLVERCTRNRDFRPILFEWYKYVVVLSNLVASFDIKSPAFRNISSVEYAILTGLLNRCSRLMLANLRLSSTKKYGETTSLLDRSISETAIKIRWLCESTAEDRFVSYLADGLVNDLKLQDKITTNIHNRDGEIQKIEQRMLKSIERCKKLSTLSEDVIVKARPLPNFYEMCKDLGFDDLFYIAIQRMGSHAVHGTWSDLLFHYIIYDDENQQFHLRDHDCDTQDVQFIIVILLVIGAMRSILTMVSTDISKIDGLVSILDVIEEKIEEIRKISWDSDFDDSARIFL